MVGPDGSDCEEGGSWTGCSAHAERLISAPQAKKILAGRCEISDFWLFLNGDFGLGRVGLCTPKVVAYPHITGLLLGVTGCSESANYILY